MYEKEIDAMIKAAEDSEAKILEIYNSDFQVEIKGDDSPVTLADKLTDAFLRERLWRQFPEYGFLTEESEDTQDRLSKRGIFIIDPVDGTKDFVNRDGQFCTNIALAIDHEVVAGVINLPAQHRLYFAVKGKGAYVREADGSIHSIHVSNRKSKLRCMRSISFFKAEENDFFEKNRSLFEGEPTPTGAAYKFCALADGSQDFFLRCGSGTKEWDVAAGDIIVSEAGGVLVEPDGSPFKYNREDVYNRKGYVMANCRENLLIH